jgi:hypothetical protein
VQTHLISSFVTWIASVFSIFPDWMWVLFAAHMVNTAPTPKSVYGQWVLGGVKWLVGQRITAANTVNGLQSEVTAVTTAQKAALQNGSEMIVKKKNGPASILIPTTVLPPGESIPGRMEQP